MKKALFLSTLISLAMICSCQKQDSTAETQLAQRKAELDAREEALVQREKAVEEREKVAAEREKAMAKSPIIQSQRHAPDAAQAEADRQRRIQQLPPELRALIPDRSRMNAQSAEKNTATVGPEQAKAERERRIQQLPPELQALTRDRSLLGGTGARSAATEDRAAQLQRRLEEARSKKMGALASPDAQLSNTQPSSPSPSPTPQ